LQPGDAIFFPPGTIHETCAQNNSISDSQQDLGCGVSITYQFATPYPWKYLRQHMRSILLTPDLEALHGTIEHLVEARHPSLLDDDNDREVSDDEWRSAEELLHEIATLQAKVQ